MIQKKTAYELSASQVTTPAEVVALFWSLIGQQRPHLGSVLDVGAGDCRFAHGGNYTKYVGVEIDAERSQNVILPNNAELVLDCAFQFLGSNYEACIGNPPYVRHHHLESPWKEQTAVRLENELGISLDKHCNLYLYFLCLGLLKTKEDGLVSFLIPYEWVSRPSAEAVRDLIHKHKWNVNIYRFQYQIFKGVLTTASISIIDKRSREGQWNLWEITPDHDIVSVNNATGTENKVLSYSERGHIWALRGLSPGSQKVFTLTEGERIHNGLSMKDVIPCVTTLKNIPGDLRVLNKRAFKEYYVAAGARCWLIQSQVPERSAALDAYLNSVPPGARDTYTCQHQTPWFNYQPHPVPQMLVNSGFTKFGPKILLNSIGAVAVGSVLGVHADHKFSKRDLQKYLQGIDFERRLVAHAKSLKKIEVKQLNTVLNDYKHKRR